MRVRITKEVASVTIRNMKIDFIFLGGLYFLALSKNLRFTEQKYFFCNVILCQKFYFGFLKTKLGKVN